ncbi:O-succinylbenzoate-CoA synthase [Pseudoalteromonas citrea]|uniref:O-succinylbenzoate-CoA synthase n=1 Tax=Pseudoalteromonas citrea TaxID=43655 RepID=A0A5S3XMV6_9GAMM|nr:enolase C-terminal domain-like protein [Pseudoalteromonas citrea]TMP40301.1 O-succinylbenzoate-CoA synthase [Pseudoalteromonas citrea]TMP57947.1 O-succinylbenzoate-CoA synthase [Pseudoalteromonas citrea]
MKIIACRLRETHIPFKVSFKHALHTRKEVQGIILEVELSDGLIGYGECLPRDYVTGETHQSVISALSDIVLPALLNKSFSSFGELKQWLRSFFEVHNINNRQTCVLAITELALLDAFAKSTQSSVYKLFSSDITTHAMPDIRYSGTYSLGSHEAFKRYQSVYDQLSLKQFKVKVGTDLDAELALIDKIRSANSGDIEIRLDANGAWDLNQAIDALKKFADKGVVCCEQPMPVELKAAYPELVSKLKGTMDICIDESLCHYDDALWFAENAGATVFNLRVSKLGGISACLAIAKIAQAHNIDCQLGAQVGETAILTAAGHTLAKLLPKCRFYEGAFGTYLLEQDITHPSVMFAHAGKLPMSLLKENAGFGIEVGQDLISKITYQSHNFS